jgi:hypothetical protein
MVISYQLFLTTIHLPLGAVMCYDDGAMTIKQFTDSPFPYSLPSYQNVLAWSIPFVAGINLSFLRTFVHFLI